MKTLYKTNKKAKGFKMAFKSAFLFFFMAFMANVQNAKACNAYSNFTFSISNKTVTFTNTSTGTNKYTWYFGDGGTSSAKNPVHTYASSNFFWVTLTSFDSTLSNCYDTTNLYLAIPGCSVSAGLSYSMVGNTVSFTNSSSNILGISSRYFWAFGDGNTSTDRHPVHNYSGSGPYTVMTVITDTGFVNCTDTLYRTFSTNDCDVTIDFSYTFTGTKTIKLTNTSVRANHFSIPFDGNGEYSYTFPYPGVFEVSLFGRNTWCDGPGGYMDTTTKTVVVPGCHADARFSFGRDTNSTFAGILYDYSTYRSGATYKWHFGDGDSSSSKTPTHVYPGPGKYNLCLTIRDSICVSTFCDTIEYDSSGNMVGMTVPFSLEVIDAVLDVKQTLMENDKLSVYPNPGNGIFTVSKEIGAISEVKVFNLQGRLLLDEKCNDEEVKVDLSALSNGVYIFTVTDTKGMTKVLKVIKQ